MTLAIAAVLSLGVTGCGGDDDGARLGLGAGKVTKAPEVPMRQVASARARVRST